MERTKIRWKNTGRGNLTLADRRVIRAGEIFVAAESEISKAFRDVIKPVDPIPVVAEPVIVAAKITYELKHRGAGWWDVVNQNGKVVNEKAMKKADAEEMKNSLEG